MCFSEFVKYDSKYYNIISNQLGNVIVAKNLDSANKISISVYRRYKVVSLDGDVINVGGSISGGSINNIKSIISEKNELEILKRKNKELEEVINDLNNSIKGLDQEIEIYEKKLYEQKNLLIIVKNK